MQTDQLAREVGCEALLAAQREAAEATGTEDTAAFYEALLQRVFEDPSIVLQHIIVDIRNDHSYHVYGYKTEVSSNPPPIL